VRDPRLGEEEKRREGGVRLGGGRDHAVPGAVRVALPPARLRPPDAAVGGAQRRRWRRRHGDKLGHGSCGVGDEPVRGRVLPGAVERAAGGGVGVRRDLWEGGVSWLPRERSGGEGDGGELQRRRGAGAEVFAAGDVGPAQLQLQDAGVKRNNGCADRAFGFVNCV